MIHPTLQSRGNADTSVVLLTGADRLSLDSVAFSLADSYASVCAISYDVRPNGEADAGLSIVRRVSRRWGRASGWATWNLRSVGLLSELLGQARRGRDARLSARSGPCVPGESSGGTGATPVAGISKT